MDFIGAGILNKAEVVAVLNNFKDQDGIIAEKIDINTIDLEVRDGLKEFIAIESLNVIQFKMSDEAGSMSSNSISNDMYRPYMGQGESKFLDFLQEVLPNLPEKFYLIFAFEWKVGQQVRYEIMKPKEMIDFFLNRNSWYLWNYDIKNKTFSIEFESPLIIEVNNNHET